MPGTVLHAELAFYPGSFPLRALIKTQQQTTNSKLPDVQGISTMDAIKEKAADCYAKHPFVENIPVMLLNAGLSLENNRLFVTDKDGKGIMLLNQKEAMYKLLASTRGNRFNAFALFTEGALVLKTIIHPHEIVLIA